MNIFKIMLFALGALALVIPAASGPKADDNAGNPFFSPYPTPLNTPPFHLIKPAHFLPAVKEGIRRQQAEIDAITSDPAAPTFANTLAAFDATGRFLAEVSSVFGALQGADTTPEIQKIAKEATPLTAAHGDNIRLNEKLFARIKAVYDQRAALKLSPEESFLLENTYRDFVRGGALLDAAGQARLREMNQQLAMLSLKFGDNLLAETNDFKLVLENKEDLAGLPPSVLAMAEAAAKPLGLAGKYVFTLQVPSLTPFLQNSTRRDLREKLYKAYLMRGDRGNERDNKAVAAAIVNLRTEKARLLGYPSFAAFAVETNMAKTPQAVDAFLKRLWDPALERAKAEAAEMQGIIDREGGKFKLAGWDWWHYAEKLRQEKYALDDAALRPYFKLDNVRQGIFTLCGKLYGLKFIQRRDIPVYHPEVEVFEVRESDGRFVGVLYMDFHPRPGKRGGAWSGAFRRQSTENGVRVAPLSTITCNFTRPTAEAPALLSVDETNTFFHEFGHSLATLLSDSRFRGRSVPRDGVELPSQIMENWALQPELLTAYAKHYRSGEVIPAALVKKIQDSGLFNQGFETVEYLAASILDMGWHEWTAPDPRVDVDAYEAQVLNGIGLIPEIASRYRTTYFNHIFNGGYAAGYYVYIWAAQLDADAFEAFKEKGLFDKAVAASFRRNVLRTYGALDLMAGYKAFRGREPVIEPLLKRRGLMK